MIVFVLYVFSLLIVQGLTEYLVSTDNLEEKYIRDAMGYFGSVGTAVLTLFQAPWDQNGAKVMRRPLLPASIGAKPLCFYRPQGLFPPSAS